MKYKMNKHDAINLYTKYVGGWGEASKVYRFEGIKDGKTLLTVRKGHNDHYTLKPVVSKEALVIEDTYDTCKVSVYLSNDFDELAYYAKEVISVNANEFVEIIGPKSLVFQGGVASFYVKSKAVGKGIITITSDRFESIELTIPVN
jgi:beta-galactosidase